MKVQHYFLFLLAIFNLKNAFSQNKEFSKDEAVRIMNVYKRNARVFMNLETCGDSYDGPVYLYKKAENHSLDRIITITPNQEAELGETIFHEKYESNVVRNNIDLPRVRKIIVKLASYSSRPGYVYHAYIIKTNEVNAFSTIGGYIYVTTGLLNFVKTEDELAFVLGHEMSHILNKHVIRKIKKIALITYIGQRMNFQKFSSVALNLNMTLSAPFDQIDEYDADRSSIALVKKAGYDETAFNGFFSELESYDKKGLLAKFTSTHPSSANRRRCLNNLIGK